MVFQFNNVEIDNAESLSVYHDVLPFIGINKKDTEKAKVFTLFHELAHLMRRSSSLCTVEINTPNDDEERICDQIAGEVLLPSVKLKEELKSLDFKIKF